MPQFEMIDNAIDCTERLRSSLRFWLLASEEFGRIDTADRENKILSAIDLAESIHKNLTSLAATHRH